MSDRHEHSGDILSAEVSVLVRVFDAREFVLAEKIDYARIGAHFDVFFGAQSLYEAGVAEKLIEKCVDIHFFAVSRKEQSVLQGGIGVADHGDFSALVEGAVAHGAVIDALADEIFAVVSGFEMLVFDARRNDHAFCKVFVVFGLDRKGLVFEFFDADRLFDLHFGAERSNLFEQVIRKRFAADLLDGGEVFQPRGSGDLSAQAVAFQNQNFFSVSQSVERGGHACRARSDDDNIVHISRCSRCICGSRSRCRTS